MTNYDDYKEQQVLSKTEEYCLGITFLVVVVMGSATFGYYISRGAWLKAGVMAVSALTICGLWHAVGLALDFHAGVQPKDFAQWFRMLQRPLPRYLTLGYLLALAVAARHSSSQLASVVATFTATWLGSVLAVALANPILLRLCFPLFTKKNDDRTWRLTCT